MMKKTAVIILLVLIFALAGAGFAQTQEEITYSIFSAVKDNIGSFTRVTFDNPWNDQYPQNSVKFVASFIRSIAKHDTDLTPEMIELAKKAENMAGGIKDQAERDDSLLELAKAVERWDYLTSVGIAQKIESPEKKSEAFLAVAGPLYKKLPSDPAKQAIYFRQHAKLSNDPAAKAGFYIKAMKAIKEIKHTPQFFSPEAVAVTSDDLGFFDYIAKNDKKIAKEFNELLKDTSIAAINMDTHYIDARITEKEILSIQRLSMINSSEALTEIRTSKNFKDSNLYKAAALMEIAKNIRDKYPDDAVEYAKQAARYAKKADHYEWDKLDVSSNYFDDVAGINRFIYFTQLKAREGRTTIKPWQHTYENDEIIAYLKDEASYPLRLAYKTRAKDRKFIVFLRESVLPMVQNISTKSARAVWYANIAAVYRDLNPPLARRAAMQAIGLMKDAEKDQEQIYSYRDYVELITALCEFEPKVAEGIIVGKTLFFTANVVDMSPVLIAVYKNDKPFVERLFSGEIGKFDERAGKLRVDLNGAELSVGQPFFEEVAISMLDSGNLADALAYVQKNDNSDPERWGKFFIALAKKNPSFVYEQALKVSDDKIKAVMAIALIKEDKSKAIELLKSLPSEVKPYAVFYLTRLCGKKDGLEITNTIKEPEYKLAAIYAMARANDEIKLYALPSIIKEWNN